MTVSVILWSLPIFTVTMLLEMIVTRRRGLLGYEKGDTFASLTTGAVSLVAGTLISSITFGTVMTFGYRYRVAEIAPTWYAWVALFVLQDLSHYWSHRTLHRVRLFWAGHVTHHSSRYFNLSTALRESWWTPFIIWMFRVPLAILGFHPLMILAIRSVSQPFQIWYHTELIGRMGFLEWILVTPSHHRVHHGANPQYVNRNFGGIFVLWDRLFRTFEPEAEKVDYGLGRNVESNNPVTLMIHEWVDIGRSLRAARTPADLFRALVSPEQAPDPPQARATRLAAPSEPA